MTGVCINNDFVGWEAKHGRHYNGFTNVMYRIGKNTILLALLLRTRSLTTTESRIYSIHSNWTDIKINRVNEWKIDKTRILLDSFNWESSVMNSHHYTTGGNSNTFFLIEVIDIMDPLILSNTADSRENNNTFVLWNDHRTEFGVDNCATRHICSKKELFVEEINTSTNIGVKGISGSSREIGLGKIFPSR